MMATARHTIALDDVRREPLTQLIASTYGKGQNKRLELHYDIQNEKLTFRVSNHKEEFVFDLLDEAVNAYNEI